jgi:uncharacterized protein (DUF433 family)
VIPHPHVTPDDDGTPCVRGTRVSVATLWHMHTNGILVSEIARRYPTLTMGQILDALAFAYDNPTER